MLLCIASLAASVALAFIASFLGAVIDNCGEKVIELIDRKRK